MLVPDAILPHRVANRRKKPAKQVDPFADFGPITLAALGAIFGCGVYFSSPIEPSRLALVGLGAVGILIAWLGRFSPASRKHLSRLATTFALLVLASAVFMARAQSHTAAHHGAAERASPAFSPRGEAVSVEGWLESVSRSGSGRQRLLIRLSAAGLEQAAAGPDRRRTRVRVLGDPGSVRPGDPVSIRVVLSPPRAAAVPGSYDFAFHAGFADIVATGFAVAPATAGPELVQDTWSRRIARLRADLSAHIRDRMAPRPGALAAALLTGDRAHIDSGDVEALRRAGLGHVLAISGMHMALLAGGIFFAVRLVLSGISPWARRHDAAIPAAWIALIFAAGYLVISGAAIPTQRAFLMTVSVLGAVILRRRALSLHTLALAVIAVLALQPQAVVTPGFQMSFAAAAALITAARIWQNGRGSASGRGVVGQVRLFFGGLGTTSLVAGTATAGFAAFHFHRIASFGLAGNLLVMPIFSLIVMPAGVLGLILIPFGLDGLFFKVMETGLSVMLDLAAGVADLPGAQRTVVAAPGTVLALFTSGFVLLLLIRGMARWTGGAVMAMALMAWAMLPQPDLFISETGMILAREEGVGWVVSDRRRSRFAARVFLEARGETDTTPARWTAQCDTAGCSARLDGMTVTQLERLDDWPTDCARSDIIVSDQPVPPWIAAQCSAELFGPDRLARSGSHALRLERGRIVGIESARRGRSARPWDAA